MPNALPKDLRNQLAKVTLEARACADQAVRAALEHLAVHEKIYRPHMTVADRKLRNRLRAKGRALGDKRDVRSGTQEFDHLAEQAAYEHWHRLLFTRFLVENGLLYSDESFGTVPVTLKDCEELAPEAGARDGFDLACRFASRTLPGVFRQDDPVLDLQLAPNDESDLRALVDSLPKEVFNSDDGLGWTYQFWQAQRKDEVNASGKKIGAEELPAVTQLFTEDYMVEFLLHNTLGAWWAGRVGPIDAATEKEARAKVALAVKDGIGVTWTYLRFAHDEKTNTWSPAGGTFSGWPKEAKNIKFLDPCMGSGHFPVFALPILARMRMEEEDLSAAQALDCTLRDNVFGLELDERCTQIAAFNVALTAWKLGGYRTLPTLHLACSGSAPDGPEKDWSSLAGDDDRLQRGMERLYALFRDAPVLGSLIDPHATGGSLTDAEFRELQPLLERALVDEVGDESTRELVVAAHGVAIAAEILASRFTLVATNVPYLGRGKQGATLREHCESAYPTAKSDLATCFVERCLQWCSPSATVAVVSPQNWWFSPGYYAFRKMLLSRCELRVLATLGEEAWQSFGDRGPVAALVVASRVATVGHEKIAAVDALPMKAIAAKVHELREGEVIHLVQSKLAANPDSRLALGPVNSQNLLGRHCESWQGLVTADSPRFMLCFWEVWNDRWIPFVSSPRTTREYGGRENVLLWMDGDGPLHHEGKAHNFPPASALGKKGVLVSQVRSLAGTIYTGEVFAHGSSPIIPHDESMLPAVWCFVSSAEYSVAVRNIDKKLAVTNSTLLKVDFDLDHWQGVAVKKYPDGLPGPRSSDPTQWLFDGHPHESDRPLHVAVARLLGYQWPRQTGSAFSDCPPVDQDGLEDLSDEDGIVCLPGINREQPAADRLRAVMAKALGDYDERTYVVGAGGRANQLEDWLRDEFFEQHCDLFHERPFIWHIWDGRKDGFHALVNYHRLDRAALKKLTYSYLGDWLRQQTEDAKADKPGAADRLGAAQVLQAELAKILEGDPPYDIFVRWKPLNGQPLGWEPDLNDGVRMNIRPFIMAADVGKRGAGVLRAKLNISWNRDRGKEPVRDKDTFPWFWCDEEPGVDSNGGKTFVGSRWNSAHFSLAAKRAAGGKLKK